MLRWRLISAAVILAVLFAWIAVDLRWSGPTPGIWMFPLGLLVAAVGAAETAALLGANPNPPNKLAAIAGACGVFLLASAPAFWPLSGAPYPADCPLGVLGWTVAGLLFALAAALGIEMLRFRTAGGHLVRVSLTLFCVLYIALPWSFLVHLRTWHGNYPGMAALITMIAVVKLADTGAYAVGRTLGRRKMSPLLSPGKTIEGACGGIAAACLAAWVLLTFGVPWFTSGEVSAPGAIRCVAFGAIVGAAGMFGDLAESLLKRDSQQKDSSAAFPGLGGILDVIDSILFAAPTAWLCWISGLLG